MSQCLNLSIFQSFLVMQLFITSYKKRAHTVTIDNTEILSQVRKVMRANIGDILRIQDSINEAEKTRYEVRIDNWNDKELQGTILSETHHHVNPGNITMIIAMPNKRDKAELIIQKLSEIGIDKIIFRPTERSVIKEWNEKKEERLQKISKEAVEQSRGWKIPEISFATDIQEYINNKDIIIFDKKEQESSRENIEKSEKNSIGIIGPEWWLTNKDYQEFSTKKYQIIGLWTTILRMETAAIIWARLLKNNDKW